MRFAFEIRSAGVPGRGRSECTSRKLWVGGGGVLEALSSVHTYGMWQDNKGLNLSNSRGK